MQQILIIDYSIVLPIIFLYGALKFDKYNPLKYLYYSGLTIMSFILYLYGMSGSISGFILTATVPYFIFNHIRSPERMYYILFPPIKWSSILLIVFGTVMFLGIRSQLNNMPLMTTYFIKASINYASLLFCGFAILYVLILDIKKQYISQPTKFEYLLAIAIITSSAFYSAMYLTRSTFIASIMIYAIFFRDNKFIMSIAIFTALFFFSDDVYYYIVEMLGTDSVSALATQDIRVQSIENLINKSIDFDYNFTENMSFSSFFNVILSLFPFTLILGIQVIISAFNIFLLLHVKRIIFYIMIFSTALFITIYQMDFLSPFVLFIICHTIILEKNNISKLLQKNTDKL